MSTADMGGEGGGAAALFRGGGAEEGGVEKGFAQEGDVSLAVLGFDPLDTSPGDPIFLPRLSPAYLPFHRPKLSPLSFLAFTFSLISPSTFLFLRDGRRSPVRRKARHRSHSDMPRTCFAPRNNLIGMKYATSSR